jgi:hypothetical protein
MTRPGLDVDLGCSMGNPLCVGGACVACETGADCGDGNSCTQNLCMAGVCSNPPVMEGTPCATGVCDTTALCEACVDNGSGTDLGCDAMAQHCIGASGSRHVRGLHGRVALRRQQPLHGGQLRVERV